MEGEVDKEAIKKEAGSRISLGRWGESLAAEYLEERGYRVMEKNFRCRSGEVDLVVKRGNLWVFVEVKTRRSNLYGSPGEAITGRKKEHFLKAALYYSLMKGIRNADMRIDVIEVWLPGRMVEINHIVNAF